MIQYFNLLIFLNCSMVQTFFGKPPFKEEPNILCAFNKGENEYATVYTYALFLKGG